MCIMAATAGAQVAKFGFSKLQAAVCAKSLQAYSGQGGVVDRDDTLSLHLLIMYIYVRTPSQ